MQAVEFTAGLGEQRVVTIPQDVAARLPKAGNTRVIILTGDDSEEDDWQNGAYRQFVRDDAPEDSVYDITGKEFRVLVNNGVPRRPCKW